MFRRLPHTNLPAFLWRLWGDSYIAQSIVKLGIPIIIGQLGAIAQQFADTIMVGQYGTMELAAAGFVNNVFNFVIYFMLGISYASTPVIGALYGKKDNRGVAQSLIDSIVVNFLFSLVIVALLLLLYFNIGILHQPEEIMPYALPYFLLITASMPFMAVFNALKQYSDAVGETKVPMWIMLGANAFNILLNLPLIFGFNWEFSIFNSQISIGIAPMGLLGAGIATLISRILAVIALLIAIARMRKYKEIKPSLCTRPEINRMKQLLFLGFPISIQLGLEASSFNICAIFMGWLGAIPLAAHQIMCTISTLCFQIVYGIGAAASVLISQFRGVGDWHNVHRTANTAFFIGITLILLMIGLIQIFRYPLVSCFTTSEEVVSVVLYLIPCFFIYQFGDCMQITFANALRGIAEVKKLMLYAFISYVIVSIPLSYVFAFIFGWGAVGVWMGMPFGLTTAGFLFYFEFRSKINKL
ncbi:MAG: MATE family efflux transporter [Prevotella sp.]|nr:MATE family efflux transporter [Prevotella sp.]